MRQFKEELRRLFKRRKPGMQNSSAYLVSEGSATFTGPQSKKSSPQIIDTPRKGLVSSSMSELMDVTRPSSSLSRDESESPTKPAGFLSSPKLQKEYASIKENLKSHQRSISTSSGCAEDRDLELTIELLDFIFHKEEEENTFLESIDYIKTLLMVLQADLSDLALKHAVRIIAFAHIQRALRAGKMQKSKTDGRKCSGSAVVDTSPKDDQGGIRNEGFQVQE